MLYMVYYQHSVYRQNNGNICYGYNIKYVNKNHEIYKNNKYLNK